MKAEKKFEKKFSTTVYLTERQRDLLIVYSQQTGLPQAAIIRVGVDAILDGLKDHADMIGRHMRAAHSKMKDSMADKLSDANMKKIGYGK